MKAVRPAKTPSEIVGDILQDSLKRKSKYPLLHAVADRMERDGSMLDFQEEYVVKNPPTAKYPRHRLDFYRHTEDEVTGMSTLVGCACGTSWTIDGYLTTNEVSAIIVKHSKGLATP